MPSLDIQGLQKDRQRDRQTGNGTSAMKGKYMRYFCRVYNDNTGRANYRSSEWMFLTRCSCKRVLLHSYRLKFLDYRQNKALAGGVEVAFKVGSRRVVPYEGVGRVLRCRSCRTILNCQPCGRWTLNNSISTWELRPPGRDAFLLHQGHRQVQAIY